MIRKWLKNGYYGNGSLVLAWDFKGVLRPILCNDINTHSDRKSKDYVKFILKTTFSKLFSVY